MHKLTIFIFSLFCCNVIIAQQHYTQGKKAFDAHNFDGAIAYFRQVHESSKNYRQATKLLAYSYFITNQSQEAEKVYAKILEEELSIDNETYLRYGQTLMLNGQFSKASSIFAKLTSKEHDDLVQKVEFAVAYLKSPSAYEVSNLATINSENYDDFAAVAIPGGILFNSARPIKLMQGWSQPQNNYLFKCKENSTGLLKAELVRNNNMIGGEHNISPLCLYPNSDLAVTSFNTFKNGTRHIDQGVAVKQLVIDKLNKDYTVNKVVSNLSWQFKSITTPYIKGDTLYFAASVDEQNNSYQNFGGFDLYYSILVNNEWSQPRNMGSTINTAGDDLSPFMSKKGDLYFSSDRHYGFGGLDVFKAEQVNGEWLRIKNLGTTVNSHSDDTYFILNEKEDRAYFSSNRNNRFYNIYMAQFNGQEELLPLVVDLTEKEEIASVDNEDERGPKAGFFNPQSQGNPVVPTTNYQKYQDQANQQNDPAKPMKFLYIGAVQDKITSNFIAGAKILLVNTQNQKVFKVAKNTSSYGEYSMSLAPYTQYDVYIIKAGYDTLFFNIDTRNGKQKMLLGLRTMNKIQQEDALPRQYRISTLKDQIPTKGYTIQFYSGKKELKPAEERILEQYANVLKSKSTSNLYCYKLGIFTNSEHKDEVLNIVRKRYKDAFVQTVALKSTTLQNQVSTAQTIVLPLGSSTEEIENTTSENNTIVEQGTVAPAAQAKAVAEETDFSEDWIKSETTFISKDKKSTESKTSTTIEYKVQIGVFSKKPTLNWTAIEKIGKVENRLSDKGLYYYYISTFKTIEEAKVACRKAEKEGVLKPFVVAFKAGQQVKL